VEPEEEKKEHLPESRHKTPQRSSSRAQGTAKNPAPVKSQVSLSAKYAQTKKQSKQNLQAKIPPVQNFRSRGLEEKREDASATKDPIVGLEPRERNSTSCLSAISTQREAEDTNFVSNAKELVAGEQQTLSARRPGSSQKTIKDSYEKAKETDSLLSAKESLTSLGPDMKGEWNPLLAKKNSLIHASSKYKFATADEVTNEEEDRRALCKAALIMGQKRLSDRTGMQKTSSNSASLTDYNQLGFNLRSNIFQGGPLESRSLMKDSYTPDITQRVIRDPKNWHGRRTDELGMASARKSTLLNS
uniref:Testis expressed 33 n=1 Tax=Strigops habroptila TaxID=2489341 RepID=A0A672TN20_STRHB